ncbi:hypothetical protein [Flavobacterium tibetense]|jgi:hypothetical protein|uniref:DUF4837 domain-containing protein n=1 Tax=Flavobacterium tibetense TaxID=2233533 RepID=A0A365P5F6_9FLAO|nr:hypothetical protein [Flavobacterium tibetense]RBA29666.1 hypothetical protein DPN68_00095 [Flavobacterium tibetense]
MKTLFSSILLLLVTISSAQFKLPKKTDWEIANTKPIIVLQLDENDKNAANFNPYIKKYVEEVFGASRIEKYLTEKEFNKFIKGNKEKYNFIGFKYNTKAPFTYTNIFFGICGKAFMINSGYLMTYNYNYDAKKSTFFKTKFQLISEADIKFALTTFKNTIDNAMNFENDDFSMSEGMKYSKEATLKSMNPNASKLSNLTLLIDKEMFSEDYIKQFKSEYKHKYEFVDRVRIEKAILDNEKGYAFVYEHFKPMAGKRSDEFVEYRYYTILYYIYSSENYEQLFFYVPKSVGGSPFAIRIGGVKKDEMVGKDEYVKRLNSVIE